MMKIILLVITLTPNVPVAVWAYSALNMELCMAFASKMIELAPKIGHKHGFTCRTLRVKPRKVTGKGD